MKIEIKNNEIEDVKTRVLAIGCYEEEKIEDNKLLSKLDKRLDGLITKVFEKEFKGVYGTSHVLHTFNYIVPERVMLFGLGKKDKFNMDILRTASANATVSIREMGLGNYASTFHLITSSLSKSEMAQAVSEGILLGDYRFLKYKTQDLDKIKYLDTVYLVEPSYTEMREVSAGVHAGGVLGESVNYVRDLVNGPSSSITPSRLAEEARRIAKEYGLKCTIFDEKQIRKANMGGLVNVSRGSNEPPRFIVLEYNMKRDGAPICLVGKGITFDSGGISIKPSAKMEDMKMDMSGAATVLGTIRAAAKLRLPHKLIGIIAACENMPDGKAQKPGDIITLSNGKTAEVVNTDAEGRLILADALSYAQKYQPKVIIDYATLTGACVVALGDTAAAILSNNQDLADAIKKSAEYTAEKVWQLPLWDEYRDYIKSTVADIRNVGGAEGHEGAGTITGAMFLKEFVGDFPWAHLDIAGVAYTSADKGYKRVGSTGFGIRLTIDYLMKQKS